MQKNGEILVSCMTRGESTMSTALQQETAYEFHTMLRTLDFNVSGDQGEAAS